MARVLWLVKNLLPSGTTKVRWERVELLARDFGGVGASRPEPDQARGLVDALGVGTLSGDELRFSAFGARAIEASTSPNYLNQRQRTLLLESVVSVPALHQDLTKLLDSTYGTPDGAFHIDATPQLGSGELQALLIELGGIDFIQGGFRLSNDLIQLLPPDKADSLPLTEEGLQAQLELRRRRGRLAEDFVVGWERRRLEALDLAELANRVERISSRDVGRGFDVVSYDGQMGDPLERHIEVKSGVGELPRFYLTRNEMACANTEGKQYWIYVIPRVNLIPRELPVPILINDPASSIGEGLVITPDTWEASISETGLSRLKKMEMAPGVTALSTAPNGT